MAPPRSICKENDYLQPVYVLKDPNTAMEDRPVNHHGLPNVALADAAVDVHLIVAAERQLYEGTLVLAFEGQALAQQTWDWLADLNLNLTLQTPLGFAN
ncbi:unnamed protein product [Calypogeia fissa]